MKRFLRLLVNGSHDETRRLTEANPCRIHLAIRLVCLYLFSACAPLNYTGQETPALSASQTAAQAPASTPSLQASIAPSPSIESPSQTNSYESSSYGFSFKTPDDFRLEEQPALPGIKLWLGLSDPRDPGAPNQYEPALGLIVYENPEQRPLVDWFTAHWGDSPEMGQRPTQPVVFFSPQIENQNMLQGRPALQYESGAWPIRYETLIAQGGWVIGIYYHRDHSIDYGPAYQDLLASLRLFTPAQAVTPPVQPTPTPVACLDEAAAPESIPARAEPLEVRFISDGNIWAWEEGKGDAGQQISNTGDAARFSFSPDGQVIAFERPLGDFPNGNYKIELWAVNCDGSNLRRLVSADQFDQQYREQEHPEAWVANLPRDYRWLPDTHRLTFGVYPWINLVGGGDAARSYWMVDTDTLQLTAWPQAQKIDPYAPIRLISPDGNKVALVDRHNLSLFNADGSVIRKEALRYTATACGEGPCWTPPVAAWTADLQALRVLVWNETQYGQEETFTAWQVPADGSPARQVAVFKGMQYSTYLSPNSQYIAYLHRVQPTSNEHELHLAYFDGSRDVIYARGYLLQISGWSPDSIHFVYDRFGVYQPWLGSVCGAAQPLLDPAHTPASNINWVDAARFVYTQSPPGGPGPLRMGQINGPSLRISPNDGKILYYEIKIIRWLSNETRRAPNPHPIRPAPGAGRLPGAGRSASPEPRSHAPADRQRRAFAYPRSIFRRHPDARPKQPPGIR